MIPGDQTGLTACKIDVLLTILSIFLYPEYISHMTSVVKCFLPEKNRLKQKVSFC